MLQEEEVLAVAELTCAQPAFVVPNGATRICSLMLLVKFQAAESCFAALFMGLRHEGGKGGHIG